MPLRYVVTKATANGEQITVEVAQCHPVDGHVMHTEDDLKDMVQRAIAHTSERMIDMNLALLESYKFARYFDAHTWIRFKQMVEVLYGRMRPEVVAARWQSETEETAALEAGRLAATHVGDATHANGKTEDETEDEGSYAASPT